MEMNTNITTGVKNITTDSDTITPISLFEKTFYFAAVGMAHVGLDGNFYRINHKFCQILGYSKAQLLEKNIGDLLHPDEFALGKINTQRLLAGDIEDYTGARRYIKKNGETLWGFVTLSLIKNDNNEPVYFIYTVNDITEKIREERELNHLRQELELRIQEQTQVLNSTLQRKLRIKAELSEERQNLKSIANHLPALIASLDENLNFTFNNKTIATWYNVPEDQTGQPIRAVIGDATFDYLMPYFTAALAGKKVSCELTLNNYYGDVYVQVILIPCNGLNNARFHCFMLNITEQKQLLDQYEFEASHDMLTGLPNRRAFMKRLNATLNTPSPPLNLAVMFIDIDNFKEINDQYGHEAGDETLIRIAEILKNTFYNEGMAARLAGDEFVIFIRNLQAPDTQLPHLCTNILTAVSAIHQDPTFAIPLSVSIGVTMLASFEDSQLTSSDILAKADFAMYKAKSRGKNQYFIA